MGFKEDLGDLAGQINFETPVELAQAYIDMSGKTWKTEIGDLATHEKLTDKDLSTIVKGYIEAPEARVVPENPDGYVLPEDFKVAGFKEFAHKAGFTQADIDGLVEFNKANNAKRVADANAKAETELAALKGEWGDKYEENQKIASMALAHLDTNKQVQTLLKATGASKVPAIMKLFYQMGKILKEDGFIKSENPGVKPGKTVASRLYPTMNTQ